MPLEKHAEASIVRWVKSQGGHALKLKIEGQRGFPDRTLFLPGAILLFVEAKREDGGVISQRQTYWVETLLSLGFHAIFATSLYEVQREVARISDARLSKSGCALES